MAITKAEFSRYIRAFQFRELFNEMGWNNDRTRQPIVVDDNSFNLIGIAEKGGFRIFICELASGCKLPDAATRKKIEAKLTKLFQEHLIIYVDGRKQEQVWQLAVRKAGCPTKISETRFSLSQDPELLYQRASGLFFTLDEEEKVTIIDVTKRVADNFQQNNERVTKKFYEGFKKEHGSFLKFIEGIDKQLDMDWYASLMLNRLMFCYFIQKKGFLDNNKNYLQDKLKACKAKKGTNKFYSFYRDFLLALFHKGLGAPAHSKNLEVEIGKIPYLNGGLFDEHEIEKTYEKKIAIDDKAFERLFAFFDLYEWHLDTRESASGKDINPDVIGYIFEKYINDRAQMGAYYTKEDITDYIAKNCIIPWLFEEVKRQYPKAFADDAWLWQMVKNSGDDYIYDAVKYGIPEKKSTTDGHGSTRMNYLFGDLPEEIRKGFNPELEKKVVDGNAPLLWELRKEWNRPAPSEIALPTEIYREVIERRKRYADISGKIEAGEIKEINDFITYNLNIRQFAQDVIETTEDAEFIRHFYKALSGVTILDPTCGSGAFLFAAMNILEPLYEACIQRMRNFIAEEEINHGCTRINTDKKKTKFKYFEEILGRVNAPEHPNLQYFIFKSIILNNLYGVDIMNEAVEIAKLRLFLKLVATVEADYRKLNFGLEPLPDVDFNIRAGNTLVGYTTKKQINDIIGLFVSDAHKRKILEQCDIVARAFARYKEIQLSSGDDYDGFKKAKDDLNERLKKLTDDLDSIIYSEQYSEYKLEGKDYQTWLATHKPFHWFAEFYEIIASKGGFDVVIGNPPYVEYSKVKTQYTVNDSYSGYLSNLYCLCLARCIEFKTEKSYVAYIVPVSLPSTDRMIDLRKMLFSHHQIYHVSFSTRPSKLFEGAEQRLTVFIQCPDNARMFSGGYLKWYSSERLNLFSLIQFVSSSPNPSRNDLWPKIQGQIAKSITDKFGQTQILALSGRLKGSAELFYKNTGLRYFNTVTLRPPKCWINGKATASSRETILKCATEAQSIIHCFLLSSTFFAYYQSCSNCRDLNPSDIEQSRLPISMGNKNKWDKLSLLIEDDYTAKGRILKMNNKLTGTVELESVTPARSKPLIDQIDCLLAQHYSFTHEELDFIINYDIKYRMGKELDGGEEEGE